MTQPDPCGASCETAETSRTEAAVTRRDTADVWLDLFGSEGVGAAGTAEHFEVWSVDNNPKRHARNPFGWFLGDWREGLARALDTGRVVAIGASPICEGYTRGNAPRRVDGVDPRHPAEIGVVREALEATGLPYVIENVEDAARNGFMRADVILCGSMFGLAAPDADGLPLRLERHRAFESNVPLHAPWPCFHDPSVWAAGVYAGSRRVRNRDYPGLTLAEYAPLDRHEAKYVRKGGYVPRSEDVQRALLGAPAWASKDGMKLCIPPAYGRWIASVVAQHLSTEVAA